MSILVPMFEYRSRTYAYNATARNARINASMFWVNWYKLECYDNVGLHFRWQKVKFDCMYNNARDLAEHFVETLQTLPLDCWLHPSAYDDFNLEHTEQVGTYTPYDYRPLAAQYRYDVWVPKIFPSYIPQAITFYQPSLSFVTEHQLRHIAERRGFKYTDEEWQFYRNDFLMENFQ